MVRRGQEMFCGCNRFRFGVRVIYGTTLFIKTLKHRFVSPMYCKLQRLHRIMYMRFLESRVRLDFMRHVSPVEKKVYVVGRTTNCNAF